MICSFGFSSIWFLNFDHSGPLVDMVWGDHFVFTRGDQLEQWSRKNNKVFRMHAFSHSYEGGSQGRPYTCGAHFHVSMRMYASKTPYSISWSSPLAYKHFCGSKRRNLMFEILNMQGQLNYLYNIPEKNSIYNWAIDGWKIIFFFRRGWKIICRIGSNARTINCHNFCYNLIMWQVLSSGVAPLLLYHLRLATWASCGKSCDPNIFCQTDLTHSVLTQSRYNSW